MRLARIERVVGACPPRTQVVEILQRLGFAVDDSGGDLLVVVPSFRRDVFQEDDVVEEVVRVWGYDKIPSTLDSGGLQLSVSRPESLRLARAAGRALNAAGLHECLTYAFVDPDRIARMGWDDPSRLLVLQNPLSRERSVLRPAMLPGLLESLAINLNRQGADVQVFEVGHVFSPAREDDVDRPAHEELWLGLALTGARWPRAWHASRERVDVYDAKGLAEAVLAVAGLAQWETAPFPDGEEPRAFEPGRAARLIASGREVGCFGEVSLAAREAFDLPAPVFAAEVSLSALLALPAEPLRYRPLPRFPAVQRDLAVVGPAELTAAEVEAAIEGMRIPLLARVLLFDVYAGEQVGAGRRSLGWSLTFQAPDRTLRDGEVNDLVARIIEEIQRRFGVEVRST